MENNDNNLDFLPDEAQRKAKEALKNKSGQEIAEIKLVMPEIKKVETEEISSSGSWWTRRKKKKEQKKIDKLRKKGIIGNINPLKEKTKENKEEKVDHRSDLFSDVLSQQHQKQEAPVKKPAFVAIPKKEVKPKSAPKNIEITKLDAKVEPPKIEKKKELPAKVELKPFDKPRPVVKKEEPKMEDASKTVPLEEPVKKMHKARELSKDIGPRVNLVPESALRAAEGSPLMLGASILILVVAIWVIVGGFAISQVKKAEAQISNKTAELTKVNTIVSNYEEGKTSAQKLQKQLSAVEEVVDKHLYWTPVLQFLEETTIPDVYYIAINAEKTGEVSLNTIAKNYDAAARQIRAFEKSPQFVKEVLVNGATTETQPGSKLPVDIVAFDIRLTLVDDVLKISKPDEE